MSRSFNKTLLFISLIFALVGATLLSAQDTSASVSGEIHDASGTAISFGEAELRLQQSPHTIFTERMNQDGRFKFSVLPEGLYTLTVPLTGFKTLECEIDHSGERRAEGPASAGNGSDADRRALAANCRICAESDGP